MKSHSTVGEILVVAGTVLAAGCSGSVQRTAIDAIASQIVASDSAVVSRLQSMGNPRGQGVIVFVKADSGCAPRYSWIWLNNRTNGYALDDASQALTPKLPRLRDASRSVIERVGSDVETVNSRLAEAFCRDAREGPLPKGN
jgi:hypothetical protein